MSVSIWTHSLLAKSLSPRISHWEKLTKYVMSWAVRGFGHTNTCTQGVHKHAFLVAKKRRQLCSLGIIRAHAEPGRQSLASWEQGSSDEASLFKSLGWVESVSVDGIAPGDMQAQVWRKKQPRQWKGRRWDRRRQKAVVQPSGRKVSLRKWKDREYGLDSIRHPFLLLVTEDRSDDVERTPLILHRWLTVFCATL